MARIPLRAYNNQIEAMIDRNDIDEAIVHCRSILEHFPKHVDTYRLMGKALLEGQHFNDAADVFHRVLSSVPDDFIAHLGMSIIREDEGNLDGAIWHMERSFEVQPSNAAIQVELRRLYGLRDGLTPKKIQLTRGALARMSAKSNLYSQAISELRTALSEDPQRPDLQVVLATMYAQTGAKMEAIETCNTLLSKLPYCLEANRILSEFLPETERAELAQEYNNRLIELNPYYAHISAVANNVDQVPDSAVTIERHDISPDNGDSQAVEGSNWAASLGISLDEDSSIKDESLEWLTTEEEISEIEKIEVMDTNEEDEMMIEKEPESTSPEPEEQEDLPDWMSEAGWEDASEDSQSDDEETPEWLRTVMELPDEDQIPESTLDEEDRVAEDADDELSKVDDARLSRALLGGAVAGATIGAILDSDEDSAEKEPVEGQTDFSADEDLILEDDPDFQALESDEIPEAAISEDIVEDGAAIVAEVVVSATALDEIIADQDDSLPEEFETSGEDLEEVPDWLQDLGEGIPEQVVQEEEGIPEEEVQVEDSSQEMPESLPETEDQFTPEIIQPGDGESDEIEEIPDNLPEWLSSVSPEKIPDAEMSGYIEAGAEPEIVLATIPIWLKQMEQEHLAQMAKETEKIDDLDVLDFDSEITELTGEDVPSWLMDAMEPEVSAKAEETETIESIEDVFPQPAEEDLQVIEPQVAESATSEPYTEEEMAFVDADQLVEEALVDSDTQPVDITSPGQVELEDEISVVELVPELEEEEVPQPSEDIEVQPAMLEEDVEESPIPEGAALADEDEEAAMAWLESLAEKQGVSEDELITSPDERPEEPPEWIQELIPEDEIIEEHTEGIQEGFAAAAIAGLAIEKQMDEEEDEPLPLESDEMVSEDELSEWISDFEESQVEERELTEFDKSLESDLEEEAEEIGVESELTETPVVDAESVVLGEKLTAEGEPEIFAVDLHEEPKEEITAVESSEWIPDLEESQVEAIEPELIESPITQEAIAEEIVEEEVPIEVEEVAAAAIAGVILEEGFREEDTQLPEVDELASLDLEQQPEPGEIDFEEEMEDELVSTTDEIPEEEPIAQEWYQDLKPEEVSGESPSGEWTPAMLVEEEPGEDTQEIRVDKKLDLNAASLSQLERLPSIGFIHAQRIINYRENSGPFKDFEELGKVPGITSEILEDLKKYLTVEVVAETAPPLSTQPELQEAWQSVSAGEIETAIDHYNKLITNDENLDEVIRDLQEAIIKFPSDVSLYQTLGDAYLHANLLQEALDAYNRAEDLIN